MKNANPGFGGAGRRSRARCRAGPECLSSLLAATAVFLIPVRGTTQVAIAAQPLPEPGLSAFERIVRAHHWRRKIESG
jgi:hypothetical protein